MPYKWIRAKVTGEIDSSGRIVVETTDYCGMDTLRPDRIEETGVDPEVFERIRKRTPGKFETLGFMGGAVSILVEKSSLKLLDRPLLEKLAAKYGPMGKMMYLAEVRNTAAPVIWNVAEPSGGMAEDFDLSAEQMGEASEMGVYKEDGWLRFILPENMKGYQAKLDAEQNLYWNVLRPGFPCRYEAPISFLSFGQDTLDGRRGIIFPGPVGDFQLLSVAELQLEGTGWLLRDLECRPGKPGLDEPEWVPLDRKIVGITPREGKSPMMYEFAPEGGLDHCGLHMALSCEALEYNVSHLTRATLRTLGWI